MKIRAITLGYDIYGDTPELSGLRKKLSEIKKLQTNLEKIYQVEYVRVASPAFTNQMPFSQIKQRLNSDLPHIIDGFIEEQLLGIYSYAPGLMDYPAHPEKNSKEEAQKIQNFLVKNMTKLIKSHPNLFSSLQIGSNLHGINISYFEPVAQIIQNLSQPDPFKNVQFAATFNVPPNTPFFPSAYHQGTKPKISIALEAADELVSIFQRKNVQITPLPEIKKEIQTRFEQIYHRISSIAIPFCDKHHIEFSGIDFSPAPYPTVNKSIGNALEQLGVAEFGSVGSVFSVGFITEALQSINSPKIGFSGFMQPLLEDAIIAQRNNEGKVDLSKLLLYSTMCGLGLDCIPIPGDLDADAVKTLLLDLGMISIRLRKPLTARLMPIPGKNAGETTQFSFEYFTDSKICALDYYPSMSWKDFCSLNSHFNLEKSERRWR